MKKLLLLVLPIVLLMGCAAKKEPVVIKAPEIAVVEVKAPAVEANATVAVPAVEVPATK
jgi:uncharacterized protein YcfL